MGSCQGTNFESKVMAGISKLLDIEKTRTTPLRPQSDGQAERYNRTLVEMLRGKLKPDQKDWDLQLPTCMMAYRSSVHASTGFKKKLAWKLFQPGNSIWLHNISPRKGRNPKLDNPWEGPFLVTASSSDVVYRIQKTPRSKPKRVHVDRLKPYLGPPLENWIPP